MVNLYNNKIITTKADVWVSDIVTHNHSSWTIINETDLQANQFNIYNFNVNC